MSRYRLDPDFVVDTDLVDQGQVQGFTQRPEVSIQDILEKHSGELARFLDQTPLAAKAVKRLVAGLVHYAIRHGISPSDVVVRDAQVHTHPDGARFVAFFDRKTRIALPAKNRPRRLRGG